MSLPHTHPLPPLAATAANAASVVLADSAAAEAAPLPWAWLLGRDPVVRAAMQRTLLAASMGLLWVAVAIDAWRRGLLAPAMLVWLLIYGLAGIAGFVGVLRSGLSQRLADLGMTQAQMVFAALWLAQAYVLLPHVRAAALQAMCLTLVFGMFRLSPRQTLRMGAFSSLVLLAAVALLSWRQGAAFSVRVDGVPALLASMVMMMISLVLSHFSRLRERLSDQRRALRETLQQVEQLAMHDSLTGLINRRHMQQLLEQESLRHARSGSPLSVALIDLDHFKPVNDTHGHHVGDEVLVGVAQTLQQRLRGTDVIARWGGEEFLLLLPDTPPEAARLVVERLRAALIDRAVAASVPALRVSFSAGVAAFGPHEQAHAVIERADQALYAAKAAGRNCCCMECLECMESSA